MIYADPGDRRADTMSIVSEGLAFRHYVTGEFKLVAKACGYLELVLKNLAKFYEAGVIEPNPRSEDRSDGIARSSMLALPKEQIEPHSSACLRDCQPGTHLDYATPEAFCCDWDGLRWTKTGHYLWNQWKQGPPRTIVELPEVAPDAGGIPRASERMLTDAGWSILNAWKLIDSWVVEVMRLRGDDEPPQEKVLLLDARGLAFQGLPRDEAHALGAAIIAAAG